MANPFDEYLAMLDPGTRSHVMGFYGANRGGGSGYIDPYRYSGMSAEDMPGDRLYADIIRAQLDDYTTRFAPVEDFLFSQITPTGTNQLGNDLARTREAILGGAENVQGQRARAMQRYGLSTPRRTTRQANDTVGALVGGLNMTRMRDADRQEALLTGGVGALSAKARNTS